MAVPFMIGKPGAFVLHSGAENTFLDWRDTLAAFGDIHWLEEGISALVGLLHDDVDRPA
ncbi:hypothetical protein KBX06_21960 [Micromonospora sp. C31]|uniref:hypothetical protein n=1 Tax=Micromonospora sp. C31 TaxID=2824876 RepID=UPI001B399BD5|nr:hypothetical protein [Micromonospora sp. C31]MBQ1075803.1 hypothetical protein [Micromonospora sp. C31]